MDEVEHPGYDLSADELREVLEQGMEQRLEYFVRKCAEGGTVWTVGSGEELIVLATEDDQPFVAAFPHPDFVEDWIESTDLDDVEIVGIEVEDWRVEVLPGLQDANIDVLVAPTASDTGALIQPLDLAALMGAVER